MPTLWFVLLERYHRAHDLDETPLTTLYVLGALGHPVPRSLLVIILKGTSRPADTDVVFNDIAHITTGQLRQQPLSPDKASLLGV